MNEERTCKRCLESKVLDNFGRYKTRQSGTYLYRRACKPCRVIEERERYQACPVRRKKAYLSARKYALKRFYKITEKYYENLYTSQDGKCAICEKSSDKHLNVDHCHKTGKIRGLLCLNCNMAIGYFKESESSLLAAVDYLKEE